MAHANNTGYSGQPESRRSAAKRAVVNNILGRDNDKLLYEMVDHNEIERKRFEEARRRKKAKEDAELFADLYDFIKGNPVRRPPRIAPSKDYGSGSRR